MAEGAVVESRASNIESLSRLVIVKLKPSFTRFESLIVSTSLQGGTPLRSLPALRNFLAFAFHALIVMTSSERERERKKEIMVYNYALVVGNQKIK